jgi:hypothetical protein
MNSELRYRFLEETNEAWRGATDSKLRSAEDVYKKMGKQATTQSACN